jgi:plasmid maintenance system antidote protein VapI
MIGHACHALEPTRHRNPCHSGKCPCINEIVLGKRSITADTALRLARYFGMSPQFWLGLQRDYDLDVAADALGDRLLREVRVLERREIYPA